MHVRRKYDSEITAERWFKQGDIPGVGPVSFSPLCDACGLRSGVHGIIGSKPNKIVCPGDWVITEKSKDGTKITVLSDKRFQELYELVISANSNLHITAAHNVPS